MNSDSNSKGVFVVHLCLGPRGTPETCSRPSVVPGMGAMVGSPPALLLLLLLLGLPAASAPPPARRIAAMSELLPAACRGWGEGRQ